MLFSKRTSLVLFCFKRNIYRIVKISNKKGYLIMVHCQSNAKISQDIYLTCHCLGLIV